MAKRLNALIPFARWAVICLAGVILTISIVGLFRFPGYTAGHPAVFTINDSWSEIQTQQGLAELGLPPQTIAWYELVQYILYLSIFYASAFILWKKSKDWFGLFLLLVFILMGQSTGTTIKSAAEILPAAIIFQDIVGVVSWQLFFMIFFFFPNGRPVPAWTRWFVALYSAYMLLSLIVDELDFNNFGSGFALLMVGMAIGSQIYRYFRHSDSIQRQQTRWVVFALAIALVDALFMVTFAFNPPPPTGLGSALLIASVSRFFATLVFLLIPLTITFAVLRYRLWDLDIIIRRTMLYSGLTAALSLVYFGSVLLLQQIFRALSGQNSPAVVVFSTLVIVLLFNPLRQRLQIVIDRRFFRKQYDAEKTLADFSASLRQEVDLEKMSEQLLAAVVETVQPQHVSLWRKSEADRHLVLPTRQV